MQMNRWWRSVALGAALLFALLALVGTGGHAHAQVTVPLDDPLCPWGRICRTRAADLSAAAPSTAAAAPAPQGDITRAVFVSLRDGNYEIYVARGDGTQAANITQNPADDLDPALSADGAQVVFASNRDHSNAPVDAPIYNLYVANADGTGLRRLTTGANTQGRPSFAPDGSRVLFTMQRNGNLDIYTVASDGSDLKRLTTSSAADFDATYTPDGTAIYWVRKVSSTTARLMRAQPDGTNPVAVSPVLRYLEHPLVSPSGEFVAHTVDWNSDGWLDVIVVPLGWPDYIPRFSQMGRPMVDCTMAGWSAALPIGATDTDKAIVERSFFATVYGWQPSATPGKLDLVTVSTQGVLGWADTRAMDSSSLDFDFNTVALDRTPPTVNVAVPPLARNFVDRIAYTARDTGGAGTAYLEWLVVNAVKPNERLGQHTTPAVDGAGDQYVEIFPSTLGMLAVRPWDLAGNAGVWSEPVPYAVFVEETHCTLTDARGVPVTGAQVDYGTETPFLQFASGSDGVADSWFGFAPGFLTMQALHPDFGTATFPSWHPRTQRNVDPSLGMVDTCTGYFRDPGGSAIVNGRFDANPMGLGWSFTGRSCATQYDTRFTYVMGTGETMYSCPSQWGFGGRGSQFVPGAATANMHKPTLTFLYRMRQGTEPPPPGPDQPVGPLTVLITAAPALTATAAFTAASGLTTTRVFTQGFVPDGHALGWVDLTPWQGRAFTVTFAMGSAYNAPDANGFIDEISITPWETPLVQSATLAAAGTELQNAAATLAITGENFMITPTVTLTGVQTQTLALAAAPTETRLVAALPNVLAPGRYRVRVTNPSGLYTELDFNVNLSESLFLPIGIR